jgi:hypothetical protein
LNLTVHLDQMAKEGERERDLYRIYQKSSKHTAERERERHGE